MKKIKGGVAFALFVMMMCAFSSCGFTGISSSVTGGSSKSDVGTSIFFGSYEQDNNTSNGKEDIEWLILDREGDQVLVISRYALDYQPYNSKSTDVTWQTCSLRTWLNDTFLNDAFSSDEQAMIQNTAVTDSMNPSYGTSPGNDTKDKVFLLSIKEAYNSCFNSDDARTCQGTAYCVWLRNQFGGGAAVIDSNLPAFNKDENRSFSWWLRSPGSKYSNAALVTNVGSVTDRGWGVEAKEAVRPAMWVNLGS